VPAVCPGARRAHEEEIEMNLWIAVVAMAAQFAGLFCLGNVAHRLGHRLRRRRLQIERVRTLT
jgi:hypothetical protein